MPALTKSHFWKFLIAGTALLFICVAALWHYGLPYIERRLNRMDAGALFEKSTGGRFSSDEIRLQLFPIPHVVIPEAHFFIPGRMTGSWPLLHVYPSWPALLTGNLQVGSITAEAPDFVVTVPPSVDVGAMDAESALTGKGLLPLLQNGLPESTEVLGGATIEIQDGRLRIDGRVDPSIQIENLDLRLQLPPNNLEIDLRSRSNAWGTLHLSGNLEPSSRHGQLRLTIGHLNPMLLRQLAPATSLQWQSTRMDLEVQADLLDREKARIAIQAHAPHILLERGANNVPLENIRLESVLSYSPQKVLIDLKNLQADQPFLSLNGQVLIQPESPLYQMELVSRNLRIDPLRDASLAIAGDNEIVAGIFDVLRGGNVPWIRFSSRGRKPGEMAVFRNMTITGDIEDGRLFIPGAGLDLTDVQGRADISQGILKGSALRASYNATKGSRGRLWLDLDQDEGVPFFLEIDVHADLAPLPALLDGWVDDTRFRSEMQRIRHVSGTADGRLILDGRGSALDITVDAAHCRFEAQYDRLPLTLSVADGTVQYTRDRIQVIQMSGSLGKSTFARLTGHLAFGDSTLIQVDNAAAQIDLDQILPWISTHGIFDHLPFSPQPRGGKLTVDRWKMEGPLLDPKRWAFSTQGSLTGLGLARTDVPEVAEIKTARFRAETGKLEIPQAHLLMGDANVVFEKTTLLLGTDYLRSANLTFGGKFGPQSATWVGDRLELGKPWRLKTPVTVETATLTWSAEGGKTFQGDMTTGGGTRIAMDVQMDDDQLRRQTVIVDDQDSHAELRASFEPDYLEVDFNGRLSSATIGRMMEENRYPSGFMEGQFNARLFPRQPGRSSVKGALKAYDIHQPLRITQTLHIDELALEANGNRVRLKPAVIEVDHQTHRLTGSIDIEDTGYVLDLVHTATDLSLRLPKPSEDKSASDANEFSIWDLPLRGRIISRLDSFSLNDLRWSPFNATVRLDNKEWHYRIEDAQLCGIETTGHIFITPEAMSITLSPRAQEAAMDDTMTCLLEKPNLIDGQFDLAGRLEAKGPTGQLDRSISGQLELNARRGRIYRFNLLSKALAVVNLTELFRGKLPDLMQGGLAYENMDIQVDIQDSVCTIKQAVIDGSSANIAGQGTVNLATGETEMIVLVAPFKTVDALVKYTPLIGDWLGGTLVSIPVRVSGPFSDPTVTPLSPSAVGSSLMNLMKKTVNLPVQIVEPLWQKNE